MRLSCFISALFLLLFSVVCAKEGSPDDDAYEPGERFERGVVRVQIFGVVSEDIITYYADDTLFLPIVGFCDLLHIPVDISADYSVLEGEYPRGTSFRIDRNVDSAFVGGLSQTFSRALVQRVRGELYMEYESILDLLKIPALFDRRRLLLTIEPDSRFPVVQMRRDRARYATLLSDPDNDTDPKKLAGFFTRQLIGSPHIDWSLAGTRYGGETGGYGSVRLGGEFLFGELILGASGTIADRTNQAPDLQLDFGQWRFVNPGNSFLREATLRGRSDRDSWEYTLGMTNFLPGWRSSGRYAMEGRTQPDWTVELYDGSMLVDVAIADSTGRYTFPVQAGFGTVERTIRTIGPHGETTLESARLQLDVELLPAGSVEYDLELSTKTINPTLLGSTKGWAAAGIAPRLTAGVEWNAQFIPLAGLTIDSLQPRLYAAMLLGSASNILVHGSPTANRFGGMFTWTGSNRSTLRLTLDSVKSDLSAYSASIATMYPAGRVSFGVAGGLSQLEGNFDFTVSPTVSGSVSGFSLVASTELGWRSTTGLPGDAQRRRAITSLRAFLLPFDRWFLDGRLDYDHISRTPSAFRSALSYRATEHMKFTVSCSLPELKWRGGTMTASLELTLGAGRLFVHEDISDDHITTSAEAFGSATITPAGLFISPDHTIGQSSVVLRAFHDRNGNGLRDDEDEELAVPQSELSIGRTTMTSQDGVYRRLPPYYYSVLTTERWTYAHLGLFPLRTRFDLVTSPTGVTVVDIAYSEGYDVTGMLIDSTAASASPGVVPANLIALRVHLRSKGHDAAIDGEVYSDGSIYFSGVPAGEYSLVFDEEQLASRRLRTESLPDRISISATNTTIPPMNVRKIGR